MPALPPLELNYSSLGADHSSVRFCFQPRAGEHASLPSASGGRVQGTSFVLIIISPGLEGPQHLDTGVSQFHADLPVST